MFSLFNALYRSTRAAVDLASVMVGIIVISIIGGVVAATVFAVIPWSQDNGAKQQLDSVVTAENAQVGLSSGKFSANIPSLLNTQKAGTLVLSDESTCYAAFKTSPTGSTFYVTNAVTKPQKITAGSWPSSAPARYPDNCEWPSSAPLTANLLPDPGYEAGDNGASTWQNYYSPQYSTETAIVHSGNASRKIVNTGQHDGSIAWQHVDVTPGSYSGGMWLKATAGTTWSISFRTDPYSEGQGYKVFTATGDWQYVSTTTNELTGSYNAIALQVHAINVQGSYIAYFDDANLYRTK